MGARARGRAGGVRKALVGGLEEAVSDAGLLVAVRGGAPSVGCARQRKYYHGVSGFAQVYLPNSTS